MKTANATLALLLHAALFAGCAEEIHGPPLSLDPGVAPATVCNASDAENQGLQTRVVLRAAIGGSFAPLPIDTLTPDASLALPRVSLRSAEGRDLTVRQVEFVSTREMALWVTRTTGDGSALVPGAYTLSVVNPDGTAALTMVGALRVVPPPTVTSVARIDPAAAAPGVDPDEAQTVCNAYDTTIAIAGTNFRPADPTPVVEVVDARGATVQRVRDADVRVVSATEIRVTLRAAMDPSRRLAPGRYGFRVTNPDGIASSGRTAGDAGTADAGVDLTGTQYPQGCHSTAASLFTAVPPPELSAVEPVSACSSREQRFIVRGAHFRHGLTVTVGSATPFVVPATGIAYASSTGSPNDFDSLTLTVPAASVAVGGAYALAVRNADGCAVTFEPQCPAGTMPTGTLNECLGTVGMSSGIGPRSITFYADPVVTSIIPRGECTAALMPVTITGMNFHSTYGVQPIVRINNVALENVRVTSLTTLTAEVPMSLMAGAPLGTPYDVSVTVPEGCAGTLARGFTLFPPPTVTAVRPGSVCGDRPGLTLTITGTNFHAFESAVPTVVLGSTPPTSLTNVRVVSETTLSGDLPTTTAPGGPYDVVVTSPVQCGATLSRAFTYYATPTITSVMSQASCTGGNAVLVIIGTGFHATGTTLPTVTLETATPTTLSAVRVTSENTILAELPRTLPAGSYSVRVVMPEGCAASSLTTFAYDPSTLVPPTLAGIIPTRGWNGIDMPITIVGTGLATLTGLSLRGAAAGGGDLALTDLSVIGSDLLNATVPAGGRAGGPYDLGSTVAGCPITLPAAYTITATPAITITGVTPPFGWTGGSTPIALQGTGFASTPRVYIIIPGLTPRMRVLQRPVFINGNTVSAVVPAGLPPGTYDLAAINPDGGGGVIRGAFRVTVMPPPTINTVTPGAGTTQSPTVAIITGTNFRAPVVTLRSAAGMSFMGTVTASTATSITVSFPTTMMNPGAYLVRVTDPDESTYADFGSFVVTNPSGNLSMFTTASALTIGRRGEAVVASQVNVVTRFLYAIGGDGGSTGPTHATVEFASVDLFGRLGTWRVQRYRLPSPVTGIANSAIEHNGFVYVLGGANSAGTPQPTVLRAKVLDFSTAPVIADPEITRRSGALAPGAWIYRVAAVMPSSDASNPGGETLPSDEVTAYFVFGSTVRLRWGAVASAANYRVYRSPTVNGASGSEVLLATVAATETTFLDDGTATPAAADIDHQALIVGSTGVWAALATPMGTARATVAAALAPDRTGALFVYALTGRGTSGPLATYEYASLSADGARLGAFTAGSSSFPTAREYAASAVASSQTAPVVAGDPFVYLTGGFSASASLNVTESARVSPGGALTTPMNARSYSNRRGALGAIVINNVFYAMAGTSGPNPASLAVDSNSSSRLTTTGEPGNFNATAMMMTPRQNFGLALASAYFFVVGGTSTGTNALSSVEQTIY